MDIRMKVFFFVTMLASLSACVVVPEKLQLSEEQQAVSFQQVKQEQQSATGKPARWGGVIAAVKNLATGTLIEVVNFPLRADAKPVAKHETLGRFRVYSALLLDPMIYKVGMFVTAVGTVDNAEQGKIGEFPYLFPVLKASHVHLWKQQTHIDVRVEEDPFAYDRMFWPYPSRYFYYSPYSRVYPSRKVVKKAESTTNP